MLEHVLCMYDEMLDELMGAQNYVKEYMKSDNDDDKNMYSSMAKQEAMHAEFLMKSVDRKVSSGCDESIKTTWKSLRSHIVEWKDQIMYSIK